MSTTSQPEPLADLGPVIEAIARAVADVAAPEIAARVVAYVASTLGNDPAIPRPQRVDAAALADRLGVTRSFVYEHAAELGGVRLGDGPRARLRFDLDRVLDTWNARSTGEGSQGHRTPATMAVAPAPPRGGNGRRAGGLPEPGSVLVARGPENRRRAV